MTEATPSDADPTVYPVEHTVGEDSLHRFILELLRPLVEQWLSEQGEPTFVGADQFIYYKQFDATMRVAPDLYVMPGVEPGRVVSSWKVWQDRVVPSFALEVVSSNWRKDYHEAPLRHAELGTRELIVFDPNASTRPDGVQWQAFRGREGTLRQVDTSGRARFRSDVLGCWLCVVGEGDARRLRLGTGPDGAIVVPTELERERAEKERERAEKERERAEKELALARLSQLEAMLSRGKNEP